MDDYIDVAERLVDFHERYPEGSLQTINWSVDTVDSKLFIVYRAAAYRSPDDPRPGHGVAWEPFPGQTSFTKNSELMNAETAAWGRAILACGLPAKRGLASRQEVQNRVAEQEASKPAGQKETRSKATTPTKPAPAPSEADKGDLMVARPSEADDARGGLPHADDITEDTLREIHERHKALKASGVTPDIQAMLTQVGLAAGKRSDELTEDQGTWVVIKLNKLAEEARGR
jgi:hypothetical protein